MNIYIKGKAVSIAGLLITLFTILYISHPTDALNNKPLSIGDKASFFSLERYSRKEQDKLDWHTSGLRDLWQAPNYYAKYFTAACSIKPSGFDRLNHSFTDQNSIVIGISNDNNECHQRFFENRVLAFF